MLGSDIKKRIKQSKGMRIVERSAVVKKGSEEDLLIRKALFRIINSEITIESH